jgi:hypothetical protein
MYRLAHIANWVTFIVEPTQTLAFSTGLHFVFLEKCVRVMPLNKKPVFLVMDYLLTGIVVALICLAAWLFYKRWVGRYKSAPAPEEYEEDYEEDTVPVAQAAAADSPVNLEAIPEPGTSDEK